MDKTLDLIDIEPIFDGDAQPLHEDTRNGRDTLKPLHSMPSSQIETEFGITKRMIQLWFPLVQKAYPWMLESHLRSGGGKYVKYSVFCIEQFLAIQQAKVEGKTGEEWVAQIHQANSPTSSKAALVVPLDAKLANQKLQASTEILQNAKHVLKNAYDEQPTLAKNLARLFAGRFKQEFAEAYATEVKQAVTEILATTDFER
jgi:hypothetical protein